MKKLLYIVPNPIESECSNSVTSKILAQITAFERYYDTYAIGYAQNSISFYHSGTFEHMANSSPSRFELYSNAIKKALELCCDCYYIRYGYSEIQFIKLLKVIKRLDRTKSIIVELPTYPYDKEMWEKGLKYRCFNILDRLTRNIAKKYISAFATFSDDKYIMGIKAIKIVNGLDFEKINIRDPKPYDDAMVNFIAVSAMGFNHAYERIIEGMNNYYKSSSPCRNIVFHMVGDGTELAKYKSLVEKYNLQKNVIFYGFLKGDDLNAIYNKADIAVASLGMHRAGLKLASTLKTREYGAKGLPIVTSCKIDCYPDDWEYLMNIAPDESPADISSIVSFADRIYHSSTAKRVADNIRQYASEVCDINNTIKPIIEVFARE